MCKSCLALAFCSSLLIFGVQFVRADDEGYARTFYERGVGQDARGHYADALADYSRAIKLDPKFVDAYFRRSSIYAWNLPIAERDYAKAADDLTMILEIAPSDYSARFNRALCYEQLRRYDDAIRDYSQALDKGTDFSRVSDKRKSLALTYQYRGRAYQWYKSDHPKAIADFTEALRLDPKMEMVYYRRGQAYSASKQYAKAADDFEAALVRDPDYPNLLCAYAWQLATCPEASSRDGKKALELARRGNERFNFTLAEHVETLAAACAETGEFAEAVQWQKKALKLRALNAEGQKVRRTMQERLKRYEANAPYRAEE